MAVRIDPEFSADMDTITNLAGPTRELPHGLSVLLGSDAIKKANKWTLTQQDGNIYLNVVFTHKPFKFRAKTHAKPSHLEKKAKGGCTPLGNSNGKSADREPKKPVSQVENSAKEVNKPRPKQKRKRSCKSPSTRRRNRQRWLSWLSRKQHQQQPKGSMDTCPEHQLPTPSDVPGSPVTSQQPKATPDVESNQVESEIPGHADSTQGSSSLEPGQPEDPKVSHTSDVDFPPGDVEEADPDESDSEDSPEAFLKWLAKQPKCFSCYTPETGPNELKKCTKCKIATYCDRRCQAEHWQEHRHMCKASL